MRQYKVQITDKALADMEKIYNYIAIQLQAPENALGQYNRIAEAIEELKVFPERAKLMESEPERTMELRQMAVGNYSVFMWLKIRELLSQGCYIVLRTLRKDYLNKYQI